MNSWRRRTNFLIKHQPYLRILPVVVISVLAVGLFSGRLLTSRAVNTYLEQKAKEQAAILTDLLNRIRVRTMALEARKDASLARGQDVADLDSLIQHIDLLDEFIDVEGVCGATLVALDPAASDSFRIRLAYHLDIPANHATMLRWAHDTRVNYNAMDWMDLVAKTSWPGGPRVAPIDQFHTIWAFSPLTLAIRDTSTSATWNHDTDLVMVPVLPIIVVEEENWAYPVTLRDRPAWRRAQTMLLLDLEHLLAETVLASDGHGDVRLVLDNQGRVVTTNVDTLAVGLDLTAAGQEVFPGVAGDELADFLAQSSEGGVHSYLGWRWNPHIFSLAERKELPLLLVSALPFFEIHGGLVLYTVIVVLMATIALLGSILAITNVGERLSNRLQAMSANMGEVASGDYSHRMAVGEEDEVGRLISYFNLMTVGLDEAHRELREKTHRLRIALARMKRLDKAKDDFLALISHEVRTPLTSILGGIEFLQMVLPQADEEQQRVIEKLKLPEITEIIESSGHRLRDFMNDAILMTSLQSSDTKIDLAPVAIGDICELVLSGLQEEIAAKDLTISGELPADDFWLALCDRELMVTAFAKLLRNAVQHNLDQGLVRIREVKEIPGQGDAEAVIGQKSLAELAEHPAFASWHAAGLHWRIVLIYNTGPAIPAEKREALFSKFEIIGRIEHHQKGSGLSLSIVRAVLENHGGKIYVDSRKNDGNYFYLILPALDGKISPVVGRVSGDEYGEGLGGVAGNEEIDLVGQGAGLDVELQHPRT